ncbi:integrase [Tanacetum coccineum]
MRSQPSCLFISKLTSQCVQLLYSSGTKSENSHSDKNDKWTSDISSDIQKILEQTKDQQRFWHVIPSGGNKFEVRRGSDAFKVDEKAKISSCRMWQLSGLPSAHAIACIFKLIKMVDDYVPECFRKDMYIKASSGWAGVEMTCHNCGEKGHNKKGCKNEPIPQTPKVPSKAGRPRKKVPIDTTNLVVEDDIPRFVNTEIDEYDRVASSNNVVFNNGRRIDLGMNWNKNKLGRIERVPQQSKVVGVDGEGTSNAAQRTNVPRSIGAKTVEEEGRQELAYKIRREDQKMHKLCNKELEHQFHHMSRASLKHCHVSEVLLVYQEIGYLVGGDKLRGEKGVVYNMELSNGGNNVNTHYGVEKLVGTNYKYWRMCMEAFLQGQDLWDLVAGEETIPADTPANADLRRKWKVKCGKALFALRTSISKEFIDHVRDITLSQRKFGKRLKGTVNTTKSTSHRSHKDDSTHPVEKEGVVKIKAGDEGDVKLEDVYHVPGLKRNLVSVPQITASGKYVLFGPSNVKILDNVRNLAADVIVTGEKKGSLFVLSAGEAYVKKTSQNDSAAIWHARLGHIGYQLLQQISSKRLLEGIPVLQHVREDVICQGCQFGKSHRLPFQKSVNRKSTMFELVHTDLMGPMKPSSYSGYCYVMVLVDDFSKYTWVKFLKEKSEALKVFVEFKNKVEKEFGKKIQCLRSDNGGEFMSDDFFQFCSNNGILRQMTCPGTPQQNGVSERKLAHLTSMSRSWLHDKSLPRELWAEAIKCASYVINRLPPWPGKDKSPFEILYETKPNVNYFRVFGSVCYVHIVKNKRTKLDPKAKKCVFVGYDPCRKGWKCMDPETKKFVTSRDVVFDEASSFYAHQKNTVEKPIIDEVHDIFPFFPEENESQDVSQVSTQYEGETSNNSDEDQASRNHVSDDVDVEQSERRPARDKRQPSYLDDYEVNINNCSVTQCFFTGAVVVGEPTCYEEAKGKADWEAAMKEEIEALNKNQTWVLVQKPQNCKPVTCKWVYRLKKNPDGSINRCKARLVARGFSQSYGLDYEETFSPVAKMVTLRTIFSLAAYKGLKSLALDVNESLSL